ncbi:MAG: hypothetical protein FWE65_02175, partial [Eggerthellaceae bacterium]|nr:hypothetical protein [Eggerthellaceae bacterium]
SWKITDKDNTKTFYSGEGQNADAALGALLQNVHEGEYLIVFSLEDELGNTYTLSRSFLIRVGENSYVGE